MQNSGAIFGANGAPERRGAHPGIYRGQVVVEGVQVLQKFSRRGSKNLNISMQRSRDNKNEGTIELFRV